jgi:hydroxymethylglutaryl-CoA lyase
LFPRIANGRDRGETSIVSEGAVMSKIDIHVVEVGPRDGLQIAKSIMPTHLKKRWIADAAAAGLSEIEVCSFVPAKVVPGMGDADEVTRYARTLSITTTVLAPNRKGAESAMAAGAQVIGMPISVSASHNMANIRKSHDQSIDEMRAVAAMAAAQPADRRPKIVAALSTSFGCSIEGAVPEANVLKLGERLLAAGASQVAPADTIGIGNPVQVKRLFKAAHAAFGRDKVAGAHFHDTRGQGLANVLAALDADVTSFDSCLAGLGGCPFAPGASGNICTEDLVWMLEEMGLTTGIDLAKLLAIRAVLVEGLPGERLNGHLAEAGLARTKAIERVASAR